MTVITMSRDRLQPLRALIDIAQGSPELTANTTGVDQMSE